MHNCDCYVLDAGLLPSTFKNSFPSLIMRKKNIYNILTFWIKVMSNGTNYRLRKWRQNRQNIKVDSWRGGLRQQRIIKVSVPWQDNNSIAREKKKVILRNVRKDHRIRWKIISDVNNQCGGSALQDYHTHNNLAVKTAKEQSKNNRKSPGFNWLAAPFLPLSLYLHAFPGWQHPEIGWRNDMLGVVCRNVGFWGGSWGKKSDVEKGASKYCISVSVSLAWAFDVVYRLDQREEINTNISAVWPAEHLSDRPDVCSHTFLSHSHHLISVCLMATSYICLFMEPYLPVFLPEAKLDEFTHMCVAYYFFLTWLYDTCLQAFSLSWPLLRQPCLLLPNA